MTKVILSLFDFTGSWSDPYRKAGYDVRQIDIKHGDDVRLFEHIGKVHGVLAAPPCTVFAGSGARWWKDKDDSGQTLDGLALVDAAMRIILAHDPAWWVLENPVGRLRRWLGPPTYTFDPCDHGDAYTKKTLLWGRFNLPERSPVEPVMYERGGKRGSWMWATLGGSSERTKTLRSATPEGFAQAFFEANP